MFVHKPVRIGATWAVNITETRSPLSPVVERLEASTYVLAFNIYRQCMKDLGRNL